jgi:predicted GIY-YIG superfamily endonuclease
MPKRRPHEAKSAGAVAPKRRRRATPAAAPEHSDEEDNSAEDGEEDKEESKRRRQLAAPGALGDEIAPDVDEAHNSAEDGEESKRRRQQAAPAVPAALGDEVAPDVEEEEEEEDNKQSAVPAAGSVYVLEADGGTNSYIGWTTNLARRLRQHNGDLVGGAKYTTRKSNSWRFAATITGIGAWWTRTAALQLEWAIKHCRAPRSRRRRSTVFAPATGSTAGLSFPGHAAISRRLADLYRLLNTRRRWTRSSPEYSPADGHAVRIELAPDFCTHAARQRLASTSFWNPTVAPLPPQP